MWIANQVDVSPTQQVQKNSRRRSRLNDQSFMYDLVSTVQFVGTKNACRAKKLLKLVI